MKESQIKNNRIYELDYLRGFALIGIIFVNIEYLLNLNINYTKIDIFYKTFLNLFIESKFFAIFSFLFGIGFFIFMRNAKEKKQNKYMLYIRRIIVLGVIGYLHNLLQPGEALLLYAIIGFFLIPIFNLNKYINLCVGMLLFIVLLLAGGKSIMPLPYFILGCAAAQFNFIVYLKKNALVFKILVIILAFLSIICWWALVKLNTLPAYSLLENKSQYLLIKYVESFEKFDEFILLTSPIIASFYVITLIILIQNKNIKKLLYPLKCYGQMALTNYIGQTILIIFIGLFIKPSFSFSATFIICTIILILQIAFSVKWLEIYKYGPLEYAWKYITYLGNVEKIKR